MPWWKFWTQDDREGGTPDYYREGIALARRERYHEALTSFRLALRERPEDVATLEQMAVVYTQIGLTDEAVKLYRQVLSRRGSPAAHYGLGFLLLKRGRTGEAVEHLRAFLAEADETPDTRDHVRHARETLGRLERPGSGDGAVAAGPEGGRSSPWETADEEDRGHDG